MALTQITEKGIKDGEIINADINASAAIAGTKIAPNFGSQNIVTTGSITGNDLEIDSGTLSVDASNNRVGIGTSSPNRNLTVSDATNAIISVQNSGASTEGVFNAPSGGTINLGTTGSHVLTFSINSSEKMRLDTSGKLGVGTTTPYTYGIATFNDSNGIVLEGSSQGRLLFRDTGGGTNLKMFDLASSDGVLKFRTIADNGTSVTERMRIDSSGKVGIGTTSPSYTSHFVGANETTFDRVGTIGLQGTDNYDSGNAGAGITFNGEFNSSANVTTFAQISGIKENTTNGEYDGALTFGVRNDALGVGIERMRLTSAGNIRLPFINGSTGLRQKIQWVTEANYFDEVGYIAMNRTAVSSAPSDMVFATGTAGSTSERMRILSGGGLTFNGDTAAANALDDYEEGSWTPTIQAGSGSLNVHKALYTKIGRTVFLQFYFSISGTGSNGNNAVFTGLPFTVQTNGWTAAQLNTGYSSPGIHCRCPQNSTQIDIKTTADSAITFANLNGTWILSGIQYHTDS